MMEWFNSIIERLLSIFPKISLVNPDEGAARTTLGKYTKSLGPGWYFYWPILQTMQIITVTPQVKDVRIQSVRTLNGCDYAIGLAVRYRIKDAVAAQLKVLDYDQSLQNLAMTACVEYVNSMSDGTMIVINGVNDALTKLLQSKVRGWGIDVQSVNITDICQPTNIRILGNTSVVPIERGDE